MSLLDYLRDRIATEGPIPFAEFMESSLYHPEHGYYASRVPGEDSDYRTSASLTPWFGRLLAREFRRMWVALGKPDPFTVIEVGAGAGQLAAAAIHAAEPALGRTLRWRFVERFPAVAEAQQRRLHALRGKLEWVESLRFGPPVTGCVLANEVMDNFPVHLLEVDQGGAREVYVTSDNGGLGEVLGPLSTSAVAREAEEALRYLEYGDRFEIGTGLEAWCRQAAAALRRGYLLVIDYGDVAPDLWVKRPAGSLVTYRRGRLGVAPLADPGECDITAHVDFSALELAARRAGFRPQPLRTQRELLSSLGIEEVVVTVREAERRAMRAGRGAEALGMLAERSRLQALAAPGGLGDLLVLIAAKGARPVE